MTCCACTMTLLVDLLGGRTVPVNVEYVQTIAPNLDRPTYDLLDASLDLPTLRTLTLYQAEEAIRLAKAQFMTKTAPIKRLDADAERILRDNLWNLYEGGKP